MASEMDRLSRERNAFERKREELESSHLACKATSKELEDRRMELERREVIVRDEEDRLGFKREELDAFAEELQQERALLKSELHNVENGKQKLKKVEYDLEAREVKLKKNEADMGRMTVELKERRAQLEEMKSELHKDELKRPVLEFSSTSVEIPSDPSIDRDDNSGYWKVRE